MSNDGLSHRAAGRVAGVSKTAIAKAIENGHLIALPGGKVTPAALDKWMVGRRAPRGNQAVPVAITVATPAPAARIVAAFVADDDADPLMEY